MVYEEVEIRRTMLRSLQQMLVDSAKTGVDIDRNAMTRLADELGLGQKDSARLFLRLFREGYLRLSPMSDGSPYASLPDEIGFYYAVIEDLTDKGMREINLLPPQESVDGLLSALEAKLNEVEQEPLPPEEKERKRKALSDMISSVRDLAVEFGAKVTAEVIAKSMGI
jgi:hypothetical protein